MFIECGEMYSCTVFRRSRHEDIDLVSEEEFYAIAPETISKPVSILKTMVAFICLQFIADVGHLLFHRK